METIPSVWEWLLPATEDLLSRGQAGLVIAACLGLALAGLALVLALAGGWFLTTRALAPIDRISRVAAAVSASFNAPIAAALKDSEETILAELSAGEGQPADTGGYYHTDDEKTAAVMVGKMMERKKPLAGMRITSPPGAYRPSARQALPAKEAHRTECRSGRGWVEIGHGLGRGQVEDGIGVGQ